MLATQMVPIKFKIKSINVNWWNIPFPNDGFHNKNQDFCFWKDGVEALYLTPSTKYS